MSEKMSTKEKIAYEALRLFAEKGYKGTSVKNIADAIGIKDSSLYKHYRSKQQILDTIMLEISKSIEEMSHNMGIPSEEDYEQTVSFYARMDQDTLVAFSKKIFLFYLEDELLSRFWRMGNMEQYQNEQVYTLFKTFFFEKSISYQSALFAAMIQKDIFIQTDPEVMAMNFYAPIYFLLSKYAGTEGKEEEALAILDKQVREFYRIYRKSPVT